MAMAKQLAAIRWTTSATLEDHFGGAVCTNGPEGKSSLPESTSRSDGGESVVASVTSHTDTILPRGPKGGRPPRKRARRDFTCTVAIE